MNGSIPELLRESRTIQNRLPKIRSCHDEDQLSRSFAKFMFEGKTHAALQLLADKGKGGVLHPNSLVSTMELEPHTVMDILTNKHPPGQPTVSDAVIPDVPPVVHPVIFDSIDATLIRSTSLHIRGAAGPSGLDGHAWRRLCTSFKSASHALLHSQPNACALSSLTPAASHPYWCVVS